MIKGGPVWRTRRHTEVAPATTGAWRTTGSAAATATTGSAATATAWAARRGTTHRIEMTFNRQAATQRL